MFGLIGPPDTGLLSEEVKCIGELKIVILLLRATGIKYMARECVRD